MMYVLGKVISVMPPLQTFNKDLVNYLLSLDITSLSLLQSVIAILLSEGLSAAEQDLLGNFITNIGGILTTIGSYLDIHQEDQNKTTTNNNESAPQKDTELDKKDSLQSEQEKMQRQIQELQQQNKDMLNYINKLNSKLNCF
jgi:hypothetical protein